MLKFLKEERSVVLLVRFQSSDVGYWSGHISLLALAERQPGSLISWARAGHLGYRELVRPRC